MKNKMKIEGNIYCAGVYGIKCKNSKDYLYVGSGLEVNDCLSRHLYHLKRELYADTNKAVLQKYYDMNELVFEVIHKSESSEEVRNMTIQQKESLQEALSTLEQFYIELYKGTVCNKQMSVTKHSSNRNKYSTIKRRQSNIGSNNPHSKYDEKIISEILWLKLNTDMKNKEIANRYDRLVKQNYISRIGIDRYIYLKPVKPDWYEEKIS